MTFVTSADGTLIGYDRLSDKGPNLVLVGGGLDDGTENLPLGRWLSSEFAVVTYRRRGRGDSGDTPPFALQREIDDLDAVIAAVGGAAHLIGASTGGALALEAAAAGLPVDRVAVHEVPYMVGADMLAAWREYRIALEVALGSGEHDEALRLFMALAGSSGSDIAAAEASPFWRDLRALAPTLRYDAMCLGDGRPPADRLASITQPVLLTTGDQVDPQMTGLPSQFFVAAAEAVASALPHGRHMSVNGHGHVPDPRLLGKLLISFFS